jgi:hypothetical protein
MKQLSRRNKRLNLLCDAASMKRLQEMADQLVERALTPEVIFAHLDYEYDDEVGALYEAINPNCNELWSQSLQDDPTVEKELDLLNGQMRFYIHAALLRRLRKDDAEKGAVSLLRNWKAVVDRYEQKAGDANLQDLH